jgi:hypothetical protein
MSFPKTEQASAGKIQMKQETMKTGIPLHGFLPSCFKNSTLGQ